MRCSVISIAAIVLGVAVEWPVADKAIRQTGRHCKCRHHRHRNNHYLLLHVLASHRSAQLSAAGNSDAWKEERIPSGHALPRSPSTGLCEYMKRKCAPLDSQRFSSILPDSREQGTGRGVAPVAGVSWKRPYRDAAGRDAPTARPHKPTGWEERMPDLRDVGTSVYRSGISAAEPPWSGCREEAINKLCASASSAPLCDKNENMGEMQNRQVHRSRSKTGDESLPPRRVVSQAAIGYNAAHSQPWTLARLSAAGGFE